MNLKIKISMLVTDKYALNIMNNKRYKRFKMVLTYLTSSTKTNFEYCEIGLIKRKGFS